MSVICCCDCFNSHFMFVCVFVSSKKCVYSSYCNWESHKRIRCLCSGHFHCVVQQPQKSRKWSSLRWIRLRLAYFHYFLIRWPVFFIHNEYICCTPIQCSCFVGHLLNVFKFYSVLRILLFFRFLSSFSFIWTFLYSTYTLTHDQTFDENTLVGWFIEKFRFHFVDSRNFFFCTKFIKDRNIFNIEYAWKNCRKSYENFSIFVNNNERWFDTQIAEVNGTREHRIMQINDKPLCSMTYFNGNHNGNVM